jgi:hypothetical protein
MVTEVTLKLLTNFDESRLSKPDLGSSLIAQLEGVELLLEVGQLSPRHRNRRINGIHLGAHPFNAFAEAAERARDPREICCLDDPI